MRTTLNIDEEVLRAAKELAHRQQVPIGQIVSDLLRQALTGQGVAGVTSGVTREDLTSTLGFQPFPAREVVTNNAQVNALRDQGGV